MRAFRELAFRVLLCALWAVASSLPAYAQIDPSESGDTKALAVATRHVCKSQVAMLGEIATHGDGHSLAFKTALVERLIDQCGFTAVFFESNQEEFLHLNQRLRAGDGVTPDDLLTAVGGLWKFYREFQPLASFLLTRAQAGRISLGGLDDQLGQLGQDYANTGMVTELTSLLPEPQRQTCNTGLHNRIFGTYPQTSPYSDTDRSGISGCLQALQAACAAGTSAGAPVKQERQEMIAATQRWINRDFVPDGTSTADRDRSMFQTFNWLRNRLPKKTKIIVWAATVHIAKRGDPIWGDRAGTNLGSLVYAEYGKHMRSLGFSAIAGSYRQSKGKYPLLPPAPPDSIEALAFRGSSATAVYVGTKQLATMGNRPGAFFYHCYQTLVWSAFLDGVVVFRTERPPTDMR